ncbi:adhesion G protein-coupled receptor E3-like isoform X1 [Montipora foliosa]|uniref:adhesion G protein-coupled receptor E3-like isoform X1 n=1 Tax=Montipora foliosa TaxID=591990 RepID=UPI0035F16ACC
MTILRNNRLASYCFLVVVLLVDLQPSDSTTYQPSDKKEKGNKLSGKCEPPTRLARISHKYLVTEVCNTLNNGGHIGNQFWTALRLKNGKFYWKKNSTVLAKVDPYIDGLKNGLGKKEYCFYVNKIEEVMVPEKCNKEHYYICEQDTSTVINTVFESPMTTTLGKSTSTRSSRLIVINDVQMTITLPDPRKKTTTTSSSSFYSSLPQSSPRFFSISSSEVVSSSHSLSSPLLPQSVLRSSSSTPTSITTTKTKTTSETTTAASTAKPSTVTSATTSTTKETTWPVQSLSSHSFSRASSSCFSASKAASSVEETFNGSTSGSDPLNNNACREISGTHKKQSAKTKLYCFMELIEALSVTDKDSLKTAINMTSQLFRALKTDRDEENDINVLVATRQLESFALKYGKIHYKQDEQIVVTKEDFAIKVQKVPMNQKDKIIFALNETEFPTDEGWASIFLPLGAFERKEAVAVFIVYNEMSLWFPEKKQVDSSNMVTNARIWSRIISGRIDPNPTGILKENVTILFSDFSVVKDEVGPHCVFWNFSYKSKLSGAWSNKGCSLMENFGRQILCSCNHLTNFAVLMEVTESKEISSGHRKALETITYIGCALSLAGELMTIIAYCIITKQEAAQIRLNLVTALAVAQIAFLSGINATEEMVVCVFVAAVIHYFYLAGFAWMLFEGVYLYLLICKVFNTLIRMWLFYAVAWGLPGVIVALAVVLASLQDAGVRNYVDGEFCWVSRKNNLIWTFVTPVIAVCLINSALLGFVLHELWKMPSDNTSEVEKIRQGFKACIVLSPLLGMTWLFGVLSMTDASLTFQYIFTIFNSLQGLFIFLFHVVRNGDLRAELHRKCLQYMKAHFKMQQQSNIIRMNKIEDSGTYRRNKAAPQSCRHSNTFVLNQENNITPIDM